MQSIEQQTDVLHALIKFEKSRMSCENGYLTSKDKTWCRLNKAQAAAALRYGVPFGFRSIWTLRQGDHAGEYSFQQVSSETDYQRLSVDPVNCILPCISPFLPEPEKMLRYLEQLMELEALPTEEQTQGQSII